MSTINVMLFKLESSWYSMPLYLTMGCYHIQLTDYASNLCTTILTWGKYYYKRLKIVVSNSPDIFQQKMNDLF